MQVAQSSTFFNDEQAISLIKSQFPSLNDSQRKAIQTVNGPVQIIAGPGSGKTLVLVLKALYLLLTGRAQPSELVITTFTEKAAFELRDRLHQYAKMFGYNGPLYEIKVGTLHSICDEFIRKYIEYSPLKKNYETLDDLTQDLFLNDRFDEIIPEEMKIGEDYLGRWKYKWTTIRGILPYFDKITEELIEVDLLKNSPTGFLSKLGISYEHYESELFKLNKIDFAHLQKIFFQLLGNPETKKRIKKDLKFIMVDEYQDTNYIQEQILFRLAEPENNICVVGDEDQSLYRFRGATVRNILEFQVHFPHCTKITMNTNYRSHSKIIDSYNRFMSSIDWTNPKGPPNFRFPKEVVPDPNGSFPEYPSVFCIWGADRDDEAERFARFVKYLKDNRIIEDYSQVALLLHSVRLEYSGNYLQQLDNFGIPYFCPRARAYFENEEVQLIIACYAIIFGFYIEVPKLIGTNFDVIARYVNQCISSLGPFSETNPKLSKYVRERVSDIESLKKGESLDMTIVDCFYELMSFEPFASYLKNENRARNLAIFSGLLTEFQNYYHMNLVTERNREWIHRKLFSSFFKLLLDNGIDDYEDPYNPIPRGYVQVMTIHQAKGLEFTAVAVGSLANTGRSAKRIDRDLESFYHRVLFEPEEKISTFDFMRQYYVAFSRAEKILVLTTTEKPNQLFDSIWEGLDQWPYVERKVLESLKFAPRRQFIPKRSYSLTSDVNVFEVCPRQYQFYQDYGFSPSRSASMTFGTLVHQTIEDIHKQVIEGKLDQINVGIIENQWFEMNYQSLIAAGMRPLAEQRKQTALQHVLNYFKQNLKDLERVIETEVDVSVEKPNYILNGKIDLLRGKDGKLEVLDFKSQQRPDKGDPIISRYYNQLCLYSHILKERYGKHPERLYIYWTAENDRDGALMEFPVDPSVILSAGQHFDNIVNIIQKSDFSVKNRPSSETCRNCDFRTYCGSQGTIIYRFRKRKKRAMKRPS